MKIGDTFPHPFFVSRPKCHVQGFVDGLIVARFWKRSKQYWEYAVFDPSDIKERKGNERR